MKVRIDFLITTFLVNLLILSVQAQTEQHKYTAGGPLQLADIRPAYDNGWYLFGNYQLNGGIIVRTDSSGEVLWSKSVQNTASSFFSELIEWDDHSIFAVGQYDGGNIDNFMLAKLDTNGGTCWIHFYNSGNNPILTPYAMMHTSDDQVAVAGSGYGMGDEGILLKIDTSGTLIFNRNYIGYPFRAFLEGPDNSFYLAGSHYSTTNNIFLMKTDSVGNILWCREYPSPRHEWVQNIRWSGGNISMLAVDPSPSANDSLYCMLVTLDTLGAVLNVNAIRNTYPADFIRGDGDHFFSNEYSHAGDLGFLALFDENVQPLHMFTTGDTAKSAGGYNIMRNPDGSYMITQPVYGDTSMYVYGALVSRIYPGTSSNCFADYANYHTSLTYPFSATTVNPGPPNSVFYNPIDSVSLVDEPVQHVVECTNTGVSEKGKITDFIISPNPSHDAVRIHLTNPSSCNYSLQIVDLAGRLIQTIFIRSDKTSQDSVINTENLEDGVYLFNLVSEKDVRCQRVVIQ